MSAGAFSAEVVTVFAVEPFYAVGNNFGAPAVAAAAIDAEEKTGRALVARHVLRLEKQGLLVRSVAHSLSFGLYGGTRFAVHSGCRRLGRNVSALGWSAR